MPRKPFKPHELRIVRKVKGAYTNYLGRSIYLGKWDEQKDEPTPEAVTRFEEYRTLWRADPTAPSRADEPLLIELWAKWRASPQGPRDRPEDTARVERLLFGTDAAPGPHALTRAADFRPGDFLDWQTSLCGPPSNYSRWTVGQCRRLILACFDWAAVKEMVDELHPAALARVKPPGRGQVKEATVRTPVAEADYQAILPLLRPAARAAVELIWLTCSRPSEVLSIGAGDVVKSGSIRTAKGIEFELPRGLWAAVKVDHKMKRKGFDRVLFFGKRGRVVMGEVLAEAKPGKPLFLTQRRRAYCCDSLALAIQRACVRAGVPVFTPYQIRHGAAVVAIQKFAEAEVGCWMGHKSRSITGVYSGSDLRTAARVALAMG